jgi:putative zinc finger/helix-turn-helix YgiT family protein
VARQFCYTCYAERSVRAATREVTIPVRGETISVTGQVDLCSVCGDRISAPETEGKLLRAAYDEYRRKHDIPTSEDIKSLRSRYGLSQRALSRLLKWGTITVHRYEQGAIPDASHTSILRMLRDPKFVISLLDDPDCELSPRERAQVRSTLETTVANDRRQHTHALDDEALVVKLEDFLTLDEPSEFTGFRRPSPERLLKMAAYLRDRIVGEMFRVRMMKLLFYADFSHFAREGVSISGFPYAALPMGPVPDRYQIFLSWAELSGKAETKLVKTDANPGDVFVPNTDYASAFSTSESQTLDAVARRLGRMTGRRLVNLSHDEPAWRMTQQAERISYMFADQLRHGVLGE